MDFFFFQIFKSRLNIPACARFARCSLLPSPAPLAHLLYRPAKQTVQKDCPDSLTKPFSHNAQSVPTANLPGKQLLQPVPSSLLLLPGGQTEQETAPVSVVTWPSGQSKQ